jgi:hypothetical protein
MPRKPAAGREADDTGRPRHLVAVPIQESPLDSGHRRSEPLCFVGETYGPFTKIGVDQHPRSRPDLLPSPTLIASTSHRNPLSRQNDSELSCDALP